MLPWLSEEDVIEMRIWRGCCSSHSHTELLPPEIWVTAAPISSQHSSVPGAGEAERLLWLLCPECACTVPSPWSTELYFYSWSFGINIYLSAACN